MPVTAQIVLPGLFDLPLHELDPQLLQQGLPGLDRILRLASATPNQAYTIDAILSGALSEQHTEQPQFRGLPMAQAFAGSEEAKAEHLLLCQAVHLRPDLHSAVIVPIQYNPEYLKDIDILINDLNDIFKVDCNITAISDGVFLCCLKQFEAPEYYPHVLSVLGKTVNPYIEQTRQSMPWYKLLNEMQMFLHQHEVNQQRQQRGQLAINSLWFWGAGSRPSGPATKLAWYCDDLLLNRFAGSLGLTPQSCTEVDTFDGKQNALIIDLRLMEFLKAGLGVPLDQLLRDIDSKLLLPLLTMVEKNHLQLVLRAGYECDFKLKPSARLKFWRRHRSLFNWTGTSQNR
jgi:hypothetical protein